MSQAMIDRSHHQATFWLGLVLFTSLYFYAYDWLYLGRDVQLLDTLLGSLKAWAIWLILMPLILQKIPNRKQATQLSAAQLRVILFWVIAALVISTAYQGWVFRNQTNIGSTLLFCYLPANLKILALIMALKLLGPRTKQFNSLACHDHRNQTTEINIESITHFSADGNYVHVFTQEGQYNLRSTLSALASQLQSHGFVQIHRCHWVNPSFIHCHTKQQLTLMTGFTLPIGRTFKHQLHT